MVHSILRTLWALALTRSEGGGITRWFQQHQAALPLSFPGIAVRLWELGADQSLRLMDATPGTVFGRLVWELAEVVLFSFCPLLWSEYLCSPQNSSVEI